MMNPGIIKRCILESEKSNNSNYKLGAVIFKNGRIISSGHNEFRTSPISNKYKKFYYSLHAEQSALLGIDWKKLKNSSILVIKVTKSGKFSMSYPCKYCYNSLLYVKIKWLYYTNKNGEILREKIKNECK